MSNVVKGYKGMTADMTCLDFKFEVGKTYKSKKLELCKHGFHFCEDITNVNNYYSQISDIICEIQATGKVLKQDDKSVTDEIKIVRVIPKEEVRQLLGGITKLDVREFVNIKAGVYKVGENCENEVIIDKEFEVATHHVTQQQWNEVMIDNNQFNGSNLPIDNVSWYDCQEFIKKLNEKDKEYTYRMLTSNEWEIIARAGSKTKYFFGDDEKDLGKYSWFNQNSNNRKHFVGQLLPNQLGVYDVYGNIWTWCNDLYNPSGSDRVLRGGSWLNNPQYLRSAFRFNDSPSLRSSYVGLRLARTKTLSSYTCKPKKELKVGMRGKVYGYVKEYGNLTGSFTYCNGLIAEVSESPNGSYLVVNILFSSNDDKKYSIHLNQFKPFKEKEEKIKLSKKDLEDAWDIHNNVINKYSRSFQEFLKTLGFKND